MGEAAPAADDWTAAAQELGIPFTVVSVAEAGIREMYEAPLALIRPDQHVAWRGETGDPASILRHAVGFTM